MIPIDHVRCLLKELVVSKTMRSSWELPEIKNQVSILLDTSYLDTPQPQAGVWQQRGRASQTRSGMPLHEATPAEWLAPVEALRKAVYRPIEICGQYLYHKGPSRDSLPAVRNQAHSQVHTGLGETVE